MERNGAQSREKSPTNHHQVPQHHTIFPQPHLDPPTSFLSRSFAQEHAEHAQSRFKRTLIRKFYGTRYHKELVRSLV